VRASSVARVRFGEPLEAAGGADAAALATAARARVVAMLEAA